MARAQFDRNEIILKTVDLFWQNGYNASSMQQVTKTTGLKPGSIYLAFGSKEALFAEALDYYSQRSMDRIINFLENSETVGEGLCKFFEHGLQAVKMDKFCSCFLVKSHLELAGEGGELFQHTKNKLAEIEAIFQKYLEKEYSREESKSRAASIMLHMFGMRVYGFKQDAELMRRGLREGLPWLPWDECSPDQ